MADQEVEHACSRNINWRSSKKQATKWKKSDISDMMYGFFHVTNSGWLLWYRKQNELFFSVWENTFVYSIKYHVSSHQLKQQVLLFFVVFFEIDFSHFRDEYDEGWKIWCSIT